MKELRGLNEFCLKDKCFEFGPAINQSTFQSPLLRPPPVYLRLCTGYSPFPTPTFCLAHICVFPVTDMQANLCRLVTPDPGFRSAS